MGRGGVTIPLPSKRFRPRKPPLPGQPWPEDKRTEAQKKASERNFGIFQLRGLWTLCGMLREPMRSQARAAVDADLTARGAESQSARDQRRQREWLADIDETDLPF